jgi:hypothetical protein
MHTGGVLGILRSLPIILWFEYLHFHQHTKLTAGKQTEWQVLAMPENKNGGQLLAAVFFLIENYINNSKGHARR